MLTEMSRENTDPHLEKVAGVSWPSLEPGAAVQPVSGLGSVVTTSSGVTERKKEESPPTAADGTDPNRILVVGGQGNYLHLADGRKILDACGGAAVAVSLFSRFPSPPKTLIVLKDALSPP